MGNTGGGFGSARVAAAALAMFTIAVLGVAPALALGDDEVREIVIEEAAYTAVPVTLAVALADVASDFDEDDDKDGRRGVLHVEPGMARRHYGVNPSELWDPWINIQVGLDRLERLIDRYDGRWDLALSDYRFGGIDEQRPRARVLRQARKFVKKVLKLEAKLNDKDSFWRLVARIEHGIGPTRNWRPPMPPYRARLAPPAAPVPPPAPRTREQILATPAMQDIERRRRQAARWLDDFSD